MESPVGRDGAAVPWRVSPANVRLEAVGGGPGTAHRRALLPRGADLRAGRRAHRSPVSRGGGFALHALPAPDLSERPAYLGTVAHDVAAGLFHGAGAGRRS